MVQLLSRTIIFVLLVSLIFIAAVTQTQAAVPESLKGKHVWPKLRCKIMDEDKELDLQKFSVPYTVQQINDSWLLVGDSLKGWVHFDDVLTTAAAPEYYSVVIENDPNDVAAHRLRGVAHAANGATDLAIGDFTFVIKREPSAILFNQRGVLQLDKRDFELALRDFNKAIELDPKLAISFDNRGTLWRDKGEFQKAIDDYARASELDEQDPSPLNNLAWVLATCSDAKFRDGPRALTLAKRACELSKWEIANHLDTLAATYAETGDFASAIRYQQDVLGRLKDDPVYSAIGNERLAMYKSGKAVRE